MRRPPLDSRRSTAATALAVLVALTGCGSTVQITGTARQSDGLGAVGVQPQGSAAEAGDPLVPGAQPTRQDRTGATSGTATGSIPGQPGGTSGGTGGSGEGPASQPRTGEVSGRGFDAKTIRVGIVTQTDATTASGSLGLSNLDFGDQVGQTKAIIAYINAHGGVLGRKLTPVYVDLSTAETGSNPTAAAERACTALTQDTNVVAVLNLVASIDLPSFYACLKAAGTPGVSGGLRVTASKALSALDPFKYTLATPAYEVLAPLLVQRLKTIGYFTGWDAARGAPGSAPVKVGIVYADTPEDKAAAMSLQAVLRKQNIEVAATYAYDASSTTALISSQANAILPFRSKGVTHVLHLDNAVAFMMQSAESQSYRPRYGLTSISAPATLLQTNAPAAQLTGSLGIGWLPVSDVDEAHAPAAGAGTTRCTRIMKAAGQKYTGAARLTSSEFCDGIFLIAEAANAGGAPTPQGLRAGSIRLGSRFTAASVFQSGFTTSRSSMPGVARDLAWDAGQKAFRYLSTTSYPW